MALQKNPRLRDLEEAGLYGAIERALWALGPALLILALVSLPWTWAARQQVARELSEEIAAENAAFCAKWGMREGSESYASCLSDLNNIQARTEERVRQEVAGDF